MLSTKFSRHFAKYRPLIPVVWSANIHVARNNAPLVEAFSEYNVGSLVFFSEPLDPCYAEYLTQIHTVKERVTQDFTV